MDAICQWDDEISCSHVIIIGLGDTLAYHNRRDTHGTDDIIDYSKGFQGPQSCQQVYYGYLKFKFELKLKQANR